MVRSSEQYFSFERRLAAMLAFEGALARALASAGVISTEHADIIARQCSRLSVDDAEIEADVDSAGNEAIPIVERLRRSVAAESESAALYVHWGATSQDVLDTALVLQFREIIVLFGETLDRLVSSLAELANRHAATPMVGRTLMQSAAPTTFGFKVAGWLDAILRHRTRLIGLGEAIRVLQFGGAVGNLGALGDAGPSVTAALAHELDLTVAPIAWHASRDRIAEVATTLALLAGSLGKIARDIALLSQSEIAEVSEARGAGRGRSSTMPQKQNPVGCAAILAAAVRVPGLTATMLSSMPQEHERGLGGWQAEWAVLPEIVNTTLDALRRTATVAAGLEVYDGRMMRNLESTNGLVFAERVSFALAPRLGRDQSQAVLQRAIGRCRDENVQLRKALAESAEVTKHFTGVELDAMFDIANATRTAAATARAVARAATQTAD